MATHSETTIAVRGCTIRVMRGGAGEPLLFLHGASGARLWLPFMETLAGAFDVIVPEHPGYGTSDDPDWLDNIHDLAYFYLDVLKQLGLARVHLVGLSIGGWLAAEIAVRDTSRLATLTLVDAAGIHVAGVAQIDPFLMSPEARMRAFFHDPALAEQHVARLFQPELEDETLKNNFTSAKLVWQPRGYDPHLRKWLHRIELPTLIAWGENDRLFPPEFARAWHALIPGSKLVLFPECGHLPNVEKADAFTSALTRFIHEARS